MYLGTADLINDDCLNYLKAVPDKKFGLGLVDPPYGELSGDVNLRNLTKGTGIYPKERHSYGDTAVWNKAPPMVYFEQLFRVCKYVAICGGNYFYLPPCRCFFIYNKPHMSFNFSQAQAEYIWSNFPGRARVYNHLKMINHKERFHGTQKPIGLYDMILTVYKDRCRDGNNLLLDTHAGSGSSIISGMSYGMDCTGIEIDSDMFDKMSARVRAFEKKVLNGLIYER
jgi:DNA modification methylase